MQDMMQSKFLKMNIMRPISLFLRRLVKEPPPPTTDLGRWRSHLDHDDAHKNFNPLNTTHDHYGGELCSQPLRFKPKKGLEQKRPQAGEVEALTAPPPS